MNITGTGNGTLTYQIQNELPITNRQCAVTALEDDPNGVLLLNLTFDDTTHGRVGVGLTATGYSPQIQDYAGIDNLAATVATAQPAGGWTNDSGSSVNLSVSASIDGQACVFAGSFGAGGLVPVGGEQDTLAIKLSYFDVRVTPGGTGWPPSHPLDDMHGPLSMTYRTSRSETQTVVGTATIGFSPVSNRIQMKLDAELEPVGLTFSVSPFQGTGSYPLASGLGPPIVFRDEPLPATWFYAPPSASQWAGFLDAIFTTSGGVDELQASLVAPGLAPTGSTIPNPPPPDLDLFVQSLSFRTAFG
jgi:hypothetical protein